MPKTIIDVEVNDSAAKEFFAQFDKHREALASIPGAWGEIDKGIRGTGSGFLAMTAALLSQQQILHEQTLEREKQAKIAKDAAKEQEKAEKNAGDAAKHRSKNTKQMVVDSKKIAGSIGDATKDLLKWVGIDVSLGGIASFLSASAVTGEFRTASGFGVPVGEHLAAQIYLQRYTDVNSSLQNITTAQTDVSKQWIFRALGINPTGQDAVQLLNQVLPAAQKLISQVPISQRAQWVQARGLDQLLDTQTLMRLTQYSPADLAASIRAEQAATGDLGFSKAGAIGWQNFNSALQKTGWALLNHIFDPATKIEPALENIIKAFGKVALAFINDIDWTKIAGGLSWFASVLGNTKTQQGIENLLEDLGSKGTRFITEFAAIVDALYNFLVKIHFINPDPTTPQPPTAKDMLSKSAAYFATPDHNPFVIAYDYSYLISKLGITFGKNLSASTSGQISKLENAFNLPKNLLKTVFGLESNYGMDRNAYRPHDHGVLGPFQVQAATGRAYGLITPSDQLDFLKESTAAARILKDNLKIFHGNIEEALAAYNSNPRYVEHLLKEYKGQWKEHLNPQTALYLAKGMKILAESKNLPANVTIHTSTGSPAPTSAWGAAG